MLLPSAEDFIKRKEGLRLKQYFCQAGVSTIGYGSIRLRDGSPVPVGATITKEEADYLFSREVAHFELGVRSFFSPDRLGESQIGALVSFAYNLGLTALRGSNLAKAVKRRDPEGVAREWLRWHHAGGKDSPGLLTRRKQELDMFFDGALTLHTSV